MLSRMTRATWPGWRSNPFLTTRSHHVSTSGPRAGVHSKEESDRERDIIATVNLNRMLEEKTEGQSVTSSMVVNLSAYAASSNSRRLSSFSSL